MEKAYILSEMMGNFSYEIEEFEDLTEAQDYMVACATRDVEEMFESSDEEFDAEFENALSYYSIYLKKD